MLKYALISYSVRIRLRLLSFLIFTMRFIYLFVSEQKVTPELVYASECRKKTFNDEESEISEGEFS